MINREPDPSSMTALQRMGEIAILFSRAFMRLVASQKKELDSSAPTDPSCVPVASGESRGITKEAV